MKRIISLLLIVKLLILSSCTDSERINIYYDIDSPILSYGVSRLSDQLNMSGYIVKDNSASGNSVYEIFILTPGNNSNERFEGIVRDHITNIDQEGYKILNQENDLYIIGKTEDGCLYGIMDLIEQLRRTPDVVKIGERHVNPALSFRAIKFNLPWAPYRPGPATDIHVEVCKDLRYWESFLDMMVENRFNVLSLWSKHLFPYMIRTENYPMATPFNDRELNEWKTFWKSLFKMAKNRGIETYIVNWNIVVSPEFAKHYGTKIYDDRSDLVKDYTRESVTQLINEYEDLTGLGVTLADWMGNWGDNIMTPAEREDWIESSFIEGMKNAERKIRFIHRAVLAGDPKEMRSVIDRAGLPDKTIVEVKFNWSHGHSTPNLSITHANEEGTIMKDFWDPIPDNYFIAWMIRNEDFFVLRWGNPEFIREHILLNNHEYVDGYFIGSEGYIPALDYSYKTHIHKTWNYAFEKQWFFYYLWGNLMYDPDKSDEELAGAFDWRYKNTEADSMLKAYSLASKVPLHIASFYKGTWDFTLYSEGFLAPWQNGYDDYKSPFISIEELIKHETLESNYLSIQEYCQKFTNNGFIEDHFITPIELSLNIQEECLEALRIISQLRIPINEPTINSELDDLETWCYLGFYFANKIQAGVSTEFYNLHKKPKDKKMALEYLNDCLEHWNKIISLTKDRYKPMPYVSMGHHQPRWPDFKAFHWKYFLEDVEEDIQYVKNLE
jgi:hypothetical protein